MKKILIFPLLDSLASGHHKVANAVAQYVNNRSMEIECKTVDILHSWNPVLEPMITRSYLWWIQSFPKSYALAYKHYAYKAKKQRSYKYYDVFFQNKMQRIISEEKPDLIICTHSFPSYLINNLKRTGVCSTPLINIYTDFFVNDLWGREMVDYHFVSDVSMKTNLIRHNAIPEERIVVTGIPVDECFTFSTKERTPGKQLNIILSGGSAGLGNMLEQLNHLKKHGDVKLYVLCGNNKSLYNEISQLKDSSLQPLPYISSRREMNELYDMADAIISKPGGVTISEAIKKGLPIFVHSSLPGQEEINLRYLKEKGLVFSIEEGKDMLQQVTEVLNNELKMLAFQRAMQRYLDNLDLNEPEEIYHFIEALLARNHQLTGLKVL